MKPTAYYPLLQIIAPILVLLTTIAVSIPIAKSRQTMYEAQARIWIQAQIPNMGTDSQNSGGVYLPFMTFFNSPLQTSSELIRSGEVVHEAATIIKEAHPDWLINEGEISAGLTALPIKDTDILLIKYLGANPERSAQILGAILDGFLEVSRRQSSASATSERAFLENRMLVSQRNLEKISAKIERFQKEHNVSDMEFEIKEILEKSSQMAEKISEEEIELQKKRESIAQIQMQISQIGPDEGHPELIKALESKLSSQQMRLMEVSQTLSPKHPYVKRLHKAMENTKASLKGVRPAGGNLDSNALTEKINEERQEIAKVEAQLRGHRASMVSLQQKRSELPGESVEWAELLREKQIASNRVTDAEKSLHVATLMESISQKATNIKIIDKPTIPQMPTGPSKKLTMAVAGCAGIVLAIATFFVMMRLNPTVTEAQQVLAILGFPIAGVLSLRGNRKADQINNLRRAIKRKLPPGTKRILVTSADQGDGKTTLASTLALSLANNGDTVVAVDTDNESNALSISLKTDATPGLTEFSMEPDKISPVHAVTKNLSVVPTGRASVNYNIWEHRKTQELLENLEAGSDIVLFDAASGASNMDILTEKPAFTVVAVRLGRTRKSSLALLASQLAQLETGQGLVVLTNAKETDLLRTKAQAQTPVLQQPAAPAEEAVW